jgi:signal transduction histidine kinase
LAHDLIVIGPLHLNEDLSIPVALRDAAGKPVVCITAQQSKLRQSVTGHVNFLVIEQREDWVTNLIVLGNEILRRVEALGRAHRAERSASESQRYASLGRYMLDMRPGVNDALTSILGNADLLLLEPTQDPQNIREQITTIHCMSLRLNEIMQRFSSLASEMQSHKAQPASR